MTAPNGLAQTPHGGMRLTWDFKKSLAVVLLPAVLLLWVALHGAPVSQLWDSESYLVTAERFTSSPPFVPPLGFRAFGYPLFLRLFKHGNGFDFSAIVFAQKIIFLLTCAGIFVLAHKVTSSVGIASIAALIYATDIAAVLLANSIMVETVGIFFQMAALVCWVCSIGSAKSARWFLAGCVALGLAVFVRPTFVILILPAAIFIICGRAAMKEKAIALACLSAIVIGPIVLYAWSNLERAGHFKAFQGAGFSSLSYVSNPCMFHKLSDDVAYIREPLETLQAKSFPQYGAAFLRSESCTTWFLPIPRQPAIYWGYTFGDFLKPAYEARFGRGLEWDSMAFSITRQVILDQPVEYVRIWSQVFAEFWTQYVYVQGFYATVEDFIEQHSVVQTQAGAAVFRWLGIWNSLLFRFSLVFTILAGLIAARCANVEHRRRIYFLAGYAIIYSLASTAIEEGSQSRYRAPLEPMISIFIALTVQTMARGLREIVSSNTNHNAV